MDRYYEQAQIHGGGGLGGQGAFVPPVGRIIHSKNLIRNYNMSINVGINEVSSYTYVVFLQIAPLPISYF